VIYRQKKFHASLVTRIRAGDATAFEALFEAFHAPLCAFAYRYVGSSDVAEEIVQEVFLFIWEQRETGNVRDSAKNYLFTSVRNAAVNLLRHERVVHRHEAETVAFSARSVPSADRALTAAELTAAVRRAVERLPERCRLIFTLHREQGLTYTEIASVLELSPKTVEVQMGRALKALRKAFEADPERQRMADELRPAWEPAATPSTTWDTPASIRRILAVPPEKSTSRVERISRSSTTLAGPFSYVPRAPWSPEMPM
jgi:RNA polymerase sigma-70 factor (ECF subfamily)